MGRGGDGRRPCPGARRSQRGDRVGVGRAVFHVAIHVGDLRQRRGRHVACAIAGRAMHLVRGSAGAGGEGERHLPVAGHGAEPFRRRRSADRGGRRPPTRRCGPRRWRPRPCNNRFARSGAPDRNRLKRASPHPRPLSRRARGESLAHRPRAAPHCCKPPSPPAPLPRERGDGGPCTVSRRHWRPNGGSPGRRRA